MTDGYPMRKASCDHTAFAGCCDDVSFRCRLLTILVLPRSQELLQQALRSSSKLVATAASDTLLQLWSSICSSTSAAATAPTHAAALRQAQEALQHGSNSPKASAAEFCRQRQRLKGRAARHC
jgi:hypothetical protein